MKDIQSMKQKVFEDLLQEQSLEEVFNLVLDMDVAFSVQKDITRDERAAIIIKYRYNCNVKRGFCTSAYCFDSIKEALIGYLISIEKDNGKKEDM